MRTKAAAVNSARGARTEDDISFRASHMINNQKDRLAAMPRSEALNRVKRVIGAVMLQPADESIITKRLDEVLGAAAPAAATGPARSQRAVRRAPHTGSASGRASAGRPGAGQGAGQNVASANPRGPPSSIASNGP